MNARTFAATLALMIAGVAAAGGADKLDEIRNQQNQLKLELDAGRLAVTPRVAMLLRKDQTVVFSILDQNPAYVDLNIEERVNLDNALERINSNLQGTRLAQDQKDVCRYQQSVGSRQKVLICGTQDARDIARQSARAYLEKPRVCEPPCNGR